MDHLGHGGPYSVFWESPLSMIRFTARLLFQHDANPASVARRLAMASAGVAATGLLLAGCAGLLGPRTVEITREELLAKLGKQFPTTKRIMRLLDVTAALPTLEMQGDKNRVLASLDLTARELIMLQEYTGHVSLSFGLRFEPKDLSIRLTNPKIERVDIEGLPPVYQKALTNMGAQFAEDSLKDYPVHQFKPEDLRTANRMGYEVKDIVVTASGLAVHLSPRP